MVDARTWKHLYDGLVAHADVFEHREAYVAGVEDALAAVRLILGAADAPEVRAVVGATPRGADRRRRDDALDLPPAMAWFG